MFGSLSISPSTSHPITWHITLAVDSLSAVRIATVYLRTFIPDAGFAPGHIGFH